MPQISSSDYENYLGKPTSWDQEDKCKIKIYAIDEYDDYWEITTRFWEFGDDINNDGESEERIYVIYKNPINHRGGCDFFIPSDNIYQYLQDSDNIDKAEWLREFNVHRTYDDWSGNEILEQRFQDIRVEKRYDQDGVLNGLTVIKDREYDGGWEAIYEFYLETDEDEYNGDDSGSDDGGDDEDYYVNIPGYEMIVFLPVIIGTIAVALRRISKSIKN